jgi:phospholipid transport system substrate-binding protein
MTLRRKLMVLGVAALLGLRGRSAGAQLLLPPPVRPDALMNAVTSEVIAILKQDLAAGQPTEMAQLIDAKILPLFDFHHMTRIAVARNWRLASPEQQGALVAQFRALLVAPTRPPFRATATRSSSTGHCARPPATPRCGCGPS